MNTGFQTFNLYICGDHTPLRVDNGVINVGIFMHLSIFSPPYL